MVRIPPRKSKQEKTIMSVTCQPNDEQAALWNGLAGHAWVDAQKVLDRMFEPIETLLVEAAVAASARRVLDVGCGTGDTTLAIAQRLGADGRCLGVDISEPMIAFAQGRAEQAGASAAASAGATARTSAATSSGAAASFIRADAQVYAFAPASFDMIVSRFGVMFFAEPVQAFANLRRAAADGAELRVVAWRSAAENPFMTTAERAAARFLPNIPAREPDAPGQFAFSDSQRVRRILEESGWAGIDIRPIDVTCSLPENELAGYLTRFGPVGRALHDADEPTRRQVIDTVRAAFDPYVYGSEVRFKAACWMISARASESGR
jgi:ubiquinone/menaquinone biosynthesis C-methylase UbiE